MTGSKNLVETRPEQNKSRIEKACIECGGSIPPERSNGRPVKYCSRLCSNRRANRESYRRHKRTAAGEFLPWRDVIARAQAADPHLGVALLEALNAHRRRNGRPEVRA